MALREGTLTGTGGIPLWFWVRGVPEPRGVCLLVHGLGEHSGRYRHVAEILNQRRMAAWAVDYRGHGRAGGRRGHCGTFAELVDDVSRVLARIRQEAPALPTILVGHSLGGLIVLTIALQQPKELRGVVASSPALGLATQPPLVKRWLASSLGRAWPTCLVPNGVHPEWLSHDPSVKTAYLRDPLVHRRVSLGGYLAVREGMAWAMARACDMTLPCLILQAGDDRIVSVEATRTFAHQVPSPGSAYHEYPGWFHEVFNETDRQRVFDEMAAWVQARLN